MLELEISQAQIQFTKLLTQTVIVVDKKAHQKKAVIIPYTEYEKLINSSPTKESLLSGSFNEFVGILDKDFQTDDEKYKRVVE